MANKAELADHLLSKARRHDIVSLALDIPLPDFPIVYIVGWVSGPVKIGYATDIRARMAGLQTGCPYELHLLAFVPGGCAIERRLHEHFALDRLRAEWFDRSPQMERFIRSVQAEQAKAIGLKLSHYILERSDASFDLL